MNRIVKLCLLVGCLTVLANGATYYVSTTGNDSSAGTFTNPFKTIKRGLKALANSDSLLIRGGTYSEPGFSSPNLHPIPNGKPGAYTTISGYQNEGND